MKVLLSAYACEPNIGSEPGVGWNWALALVRRGHEVWVITRSNNQNAIEQEMDKIGEPYTSSLHFLYYDLPKSLTWWKKGRRGVHLYYLLWQWGAYQLAKVVHKTQVFDLVHHITFVSARQPSFMGNLEIPFIFGPVAGGESAPWALRKSFGWKGWLNDFVRDLANLAVHFDPLMWQTFSLANKIYVTSDQTLSLVPQRYRKKTTVQLAIAVDNNIEKKQKPLESLNLVPITNTFRILYVGHFLYLKGMHLGLLAFYNLLKQLPYAHLTLVGHGPEEKKWKELAQQLGINQSQISWQPWVAQAELGALYQSHDVFLFPSLRDSGGMVVLEAMSHGLPVVCLKLGGPGVIVDDTCGRAINVNGLTQKNVVTSLTEAVAELATNTELIQKMRDGARSRALTYSWDGAVDRTYATLEKVK